MIPLLLGLALAEAPPPPRNVLVITVDALRPDRMALYGYDRPTTPYLDRFASESVVFERAFATGAWTSPGIASLFSGLHAPAHGQNSRYDYVDATLTTPLDVLRARGMRGIARDAEQATIRGLGFTVAYNPVLHDGVEVVDWLAHQGDGWIAWVHVKPTHLPYAPSPFHLRRFGGDRMDSPAITAVRTSGTVYPRDYGLSWKPPVIEAFTPDEQAVVSDLYDGAVADADALLGQMIETLRSAGKLDRTLLVISADHGEELFDHGWVGHASTGYEGKVYDELIRVPLIIRPPGGASGRVPALVSQIDVMPTVFELVGADPAAVDGGMQGLSLAPWLRGEPGPSHDVVYARTTFKGWTCPYGETRDGLTAARAADRKVIRVRQGDTIRHEAYDLVEDPQERRDLYAADPGRFADLVAALDRWDRAAAEHAAGLMLIAGERRLAELRAAADKRDAVAAAQSWLALVELERTYGNEVVRPLDLPGIAGRWARIRREAIRLRDLAGR